MIQQTTLADGLRALPAGDRALLKGLVGAALAALAAGVAFGALTAFVRAGVLAVPPVAGYRLMTLHGVTVFFYWLYFAQAALLLAFAAVYAGGGRRIAAATGAWLGFALMLAGFAASEAGALAGAPLLYDGSPELVADRGAAGLFYAGYLLLGVGLFLVAAAAVVTAIQAKLEGRAGAWSSVGFGTVAWAGLVMVSAVAVANAFLPAALWAFGWAEPPADHNTAWHLLFHNLHYLPLMGTVLTWYVLVREMTGVGSIFGDRFSKVVFAGYLVFVPPTSLYHMFLEPGLAEAVRLVGSLLSLFIGVPTVAAFLVVVASLEAHARARGARGLFGWLRLLPWHDPAVAALGMAAANLAFGGTLAFVLIQERLAGLLSDTFFVPAYFHFLTIGTVTLTLLAAFGRVVPALTGRPLWRPALLARLPYAVTAGLVLFGTAGVAAGLLGMPRRALEVAYAGAAPAAWSRLSAVVGAGAVIVGAALAVHVYGLARTLLSRAGAPASAEADAVRVRLVTPGDAALRQAAWTGPLSVALLVAAMYAATATAFAVMRALPVIAPAGGGH